MNMPISASYSIIIDITVAVTEIKTFTYSQNHQQQRKARTIHLHEIHSQYNHLNKIIHKVIKLFISISFLLTEPAEKLHYLL